jgi:hypothetical protein
MADCIRCLELHGRGCTATHENEAGDPSCVFCLDKVPCPVQQKPWRWEKTLATSTTVDLRRSKGSHKEGEENMETRTAETHATHATAAARICRKPGCTTPLGPKNQSGLCGPHFHWIDPAKRSSSRGNGHAASGSSPSNGHAGTGRDGAATKAKNGNGAAVGIESVETIPDLARDFIEDRVDRLILGLPAACKARIATDWLRGRI